MESKIAGYKLVPATNMCDGCVFENEKHCPWSDDAILDCVTKNAIYVPDDTVIEVPADTSIEVPKTNQQNK